MVESSVSISEYWSMPSWEIQSTYIITQFDLPHPSWSADDLAILSNNRPHLWEDKDSKWICLKPKALAMQGNPNPEFRILGFGIRNPRRRLQYPGLSWIPLHGARQGDALTPDAWRNWNLLLTLFIWAALLAMKMDLREISIREGRKSSEGYLV